MSLRTTHIPFLSVFIRQTASLLCVFTVFFLASHTAQAQSRAEIENKLKAAYLLNFLQFVEWPETEELEHHEFILGVIGKDQFGGILDETFANEMIGERPIAIQRFRTADDLAHCDALFISSSEKNRLAEIFLKLGDSSVLTVSDIPRFEDLGGGIGFFLDGNKLRFAVNIQVMKFAGLKVSSKLLRLAKIVDPS